MQRTLVLLVLLVAGSVSARELLQRGLRAPCLVQDQVYPFQSCTNFNRNVTCWVTNTFWPKQTCGTSTNMTVCAQNWGQWPTEAACCRPGAAFPDGCTQAKPCWAPSKWYPNAECALTEDQSVCQRGWGAYASKEACCAPGAGHSEGCSDAPDS
ncbi:hypothetical protein N2152v2_003297 [Parachlorella kessleri]